MRRILFVDDSPNTRAEMLRLAEPLKRDWDFHFAAGGDEAWAMTGKGAFDVVIADWEMPGMSGSDLLFRIMHRHPHTIRIALSEKLERDLLFRTLGASHQHLFKPCQPEELAEVLNRSMILGDLLKNERLRKLVSSVLSLPSIPELYLELLDELRKDDPSPHAAGQIISRDLGMCSKLLQFVNSAFWGLSRELTDPTEAVLFLGLDTVKALVLSLQIFSMYDKSPIKEFSFGELWTHSWRTAVLARRIAESEGQDRLESDAAFVAGLLHDVGKLLMVTGLPSQYQQVLRDGALPRYLSEASIFQCTHAEVGGYLLGLWGLPTRIMQAAAFHHEPARAQAAEFCPLAAVHAANLLEHASGNVRQAESQIDQPFLRSLGLDAPVKLKEWAELRAE